MKGNVKMKKQSNLETEKMNVYENMKQYQIIEDDPPEDLAEEIAIKNSIYSAILHANSILAKRIVLEFFNRLNSMSSDAIFDVCTNYYKLTPLIESIEWFANDEELEAVFEEVFDVMRMPDNHLIRVLKTLLRHYIELLQREVDILEQVHADEEMLASYMFSKER